jgi:CBS-domain-containing membrane protein
MSSPAVTCRAQDSLEEAARLLWEHDCGILPVVDQDGRAGATITDRDICMGAYTRGCRLAEAQVAESMSRRLVSCKPDDDVSLATRLMIEHQVRRIIVVDEDDLPVGVLSLNDLACAAPRDAALGRQALRALTAVSRHPGQAETAALPQRPYRLDELVDVHAVAEG